MRWTYRTKRHKLVSEIVTKPFDRVSKIATVIDYSRRKDRHNPRKPMKTMKQQSFSSADRQPNVLTPPSAARSTHRNHPSRVNEQYLTDERLQAAARHRRINYVSPLAAVPAVLGS